MIGRLYRLFCAGCGGLLFILAVLARHGSVVTIGRRVTVHAGGQSVNLNPVVALLVPGGILTLALLCQPRMRRALRRVIASPQERLVAAAVAAAMAITLIPAAPSGRQIVVYLALATSGFSLLLIGLWAQLFPRMQGGAATALRLFRRLPTPWFVSGLFFLVFISANVVSWAVFEHIPHVQDSIAQLFQAHLFAHARASAPAPLYPEFFDYTHVINTPRWYSQFPPGHSALLTIGLWLGMPWIVNPALGGATVVVIYFLGRELYGETVARTAAVLAALSPFLLFMSSEYMNHSSTLLWLCLFLLGYARAVRTAAYLPAIGAGFTLGAAAIIRPLTALATAVPFAMHAVREVWRTPRRLLPVMLVMGLAVVPPLAGFLVFNHQTTGSALTLGYTAKHGEGHSIGFGHSGWGPPHTIRRGIVHTLNNLNGLQRYLFEWPIPSLTLVMALGLCWQRSSWDGWLLASWLSLTIAYFFYWYQDLCFGPRFQFEALAALTLLSARGLQRLPELLRVWSGGRVRREIVQQSAAVAIGLCVLVMATVHLPELIKTYARSYWRVDGRVYRSVRNAGIHHAVVFVNSNYGSAFLGNFREGIEPNGDIVYARNVAGAGSTLMAAYSGRTFFLADDGELAQIQHPSDLIPAQVHKWDATWHLERCGMAIEPGVVRSFEGKHAVLRTYPVDVSTPCVLTREVPRRADAVLDICVAAEPDGAWKLRVYVDERLVDDRVIERTNDTRRWQSGRYDLGSQTDGVSADKATVVVRLENEFASGAHSAAYWAYARVSSAMAPAPACAGQPRSGRDADVAESVRDWWSLVPVMSEMVIGAG